MSASQICLGIIILWLLGTLVWWFVIFPWIERHTPSPLDDEEMK